MIPETFKYLGCKYHVVAKILDNDEFFIVTKRYRKEKQRWHYEVFSDFIFKGIIGDKK